MKRRWAPPIGPVWLGNCFGKLLNRNSSVGTRFKITSTADVHAYTRLLAPAQLVNYWTISGVSQRMSGACVHRIYVSLVAAKDAPSTHSTRTSHRRATARFETTVADYYNLSSLLSVQEWSRRRSQQVTTGDRCDTKHCSARLL